MIKIIFYIFFIALFFVGNLVFAHEDENLICTQAFTWFHRWNPFSGRCEEIYHRDGCAPKGWPKEGRCPARLFEEKKSSVKGTGNKNRERDIFQAFLRPNRPNRLNRSGDCL